MKRLFFALLLIAVASSMFAQQEPTRERGFKPEQIYQFNGFDSVNLFNGNLNLSVPLGPTYPVGRGLAYSFSLHYSGNVWRTVYHCPNTQQDSECGMHYMMHFGDNAGPGWRLSFGELRAPSPTARPHTAASMWEYRSPDASEHLFHSTLYDPICTVSGQTTCDNEVPGVGYTRDGTYLRLQDAPGGAKVVEFGNGQRQRFTVVDAKWRLQYIYSVFSTLVDGIPTSNYVEFEYPAGSSDWVITDSHGRAHRVYFQNGEVDKVEVAAFARLGDPSNVTATYNVTYGDYTIGTNGPVDGPAVNVREPCDAIPLGNTQLMHFLTRVDLPSGEHYGFAYHQPTTSCDDNSATLIEATFPTGGGLAWKYQRYGFVVTPIDYASGLKERLVKDANGAVIQKTTYEFVSQGEPGHDVIVQQCRQWTDTTCVPETKTVHHFTTGRETAFGYGPGFGLPVSPTLDDPQSGLPMSTQTFACPPSSGCSATPERSMYLSHDWDFTTTPSTTLCNFQYPCVRNSGRRVKVERTVYDRDGGKYAQTAYSLFDGLGHYRKAVTSGDFSSGNARTTETNYNSHSRGGGSVGVYSLTAEGYRASGYTSLLATDPWVLGTYGNAYALENGASNDTHTCFDQLTGFLKRQRTLASTSGVAGANDLLAVFTQDSATGFVKKEEYFGGDHREVGQPNLPVTDLCTLAVPTHDKYTFRLDHTYLYGTLSTSQYWKADGSAMPFVSVQNTIDRNTGLVASSTDPAGVKTDYRYDRSGRLDLVDQPTGGLSDTTYNYVNAASDTAASVTVTTGAGLASASTKYEFDDVGRVWRQHHLMPDASWSVIEMRYDALGRRSYVSEKETYTNTSFVPAHKTLFSNYDAFGRVGLITAPDQKTTSITYLGDRLTTHTTNVATSAGVATPAIRVEERDRAGRLWRVTENGNDITTYGYDAGNRLASVTMGSQNRAFTYDGRGFLTSEQHPESGTTSYQYDARGHVVKRLGAVATLTNEYDRAERLLNVSHDGVGLLKEFVYDRANVPNVDYSLGKVAEAVRHNRSDALGDVMVKEKYTYATRRGLLSRKDTTITTVKSGVTTGGEEFSDHYGYNDLGSVSMVTYPMCESGCNGQSGPSRVVSTTYKHGLPTDVGPYTQSINYHPNGLLHTVRHAGVGMTGAVVNGPLYTQEIATNGMARPNTISVANFCDSTNLRIDTHPSDTTVASGSSAGLSVAAPGATQWQWYKVNGSESTAIAGQTTNTLTSTVTAESTFWVRVGNGNCSIDSNRATVYIASVVCPTVTLSVDDSSPIAQGGSKVIHAVITGPSAQSWTIQWSDQSQTTTTTSASFDRTVTPPQTIQYTLTLLASGSCASTVSNPINVTVIPPAPADVVATAASASQINVSWSYSGQAEYFVVERRDPGQGSFAHVGATSYPVMFFADAAVTPNTAYLYRVRALKADTSSAASGFDLATSVIFAPDPIPLHASLSAQTVLQLRTAANAVRALWNIAAGPFAFTDTTLAGVHARTNHVIEIRDVLAAARNGLGLPPLQYTGPTPQALQPLVISDINDLRGGVR